MANEITTVFGLSAAKGGKIMSPNTQTKTQDMNGNDLALLTGTATTTAAVVPVGIVDTAKMHTLMIENLDATNYIELSNTTSTEFNDEIFARLLPNSGVAIVTRAAPTYYRANGGDCEVNIRAVENAA